MCIFNLVSQGNVQEEQELQVEVQFLVKLDEENITSCALDKMILLSQSQEFQISVKANQSSFCYVIDETPFGIMFEMFKTALKPQKTVYMPNSQTWYVLSKPRGKERLHVIVSAFQLKQFEKNLEMLIRNENSYSASTTVSEALDNLVKMASSEKSSKSLFVKTITINH
jgi:hypothetical protein